MTVEYIYPNAAKAKNLTLVQRARYDELFATPEKLLPTLLRERLEAVRKEFSVFGSGEGWSQWSELVEDAHAAWVLGGEDPQRVKWVDTKTKPLPREHDPDEVRRHEEACRRYPVRTKSEEELELMRQAHERLNSNSWWSLIRDLFRF